MRCLLLVVSCSLLVVRCLLLCVVCCWLLWLFLCECVVLFGVLWCVVVCRLVGRSFVVSSVLIDVGCLLCVLC